MRPQNHSTEIELKQFLSEKEYHQILHVCETNIFLSNEIRVVFGVVANLLIDNLGAAQEIWLNYWLDSDISMVESLSKKLTSSLEVLLIEELKLENRHTILNSYSFLKEINEGYSNEKIDQFLIDCFPVFLEQISQLIQNTDYDAAIECCQSLLCIDETSRKTWHQLAIAYYYVGALVEAEDAIQVALSGNSKDAECHFTYGLIQQQQQDYQEAIASLQKAIQLQPNLAKAYVRLGQIYEINDAIPEAQQTYQHYIEQLPSDWQGYYHLGQLLANSDQIHSAREIFKQALSLAPHQPLIHQALGNLETGVSNSVQASFHYGYQHYHQKEFAQALLHFQACLTYPEAPDFLFFHTADAYYKVGSIDEAIRIYYQGLDRHPQSTLLYQWLIYTLHNNDHLYEAFQVIEQAIQHTEQPAVFHFQKLSILPILYETKEEIEIARTFFENNLQKLIELFETEKLAPHTAIPDDPLLLTNTFFLQYQGKNDKTIQSRYSQLLHQLMTCKYGALLPDKFKINPERKKRRIGYFSNCFRAHTVGHLMLGWFKHRDRESFEVYIYYYDTRDYAIDWMTKQFQTYSDQFRYFNKSSIPTVIETVLQDELDILVYIDVGMVPITNYLASIRLAPIQCTTWGHPITTGSPAMDYFLSSDLMEPENGQNHYTETLIRLPNLGIVYNPPPMPTPPYTRDYFGLPEDAVIYVCSQSLFKYLPQYDYIFAEIAVQVPEALFVFLASSQSSLITQKFAGRLHRAFAAYNLDSEQFVRILPRLSAEEFLGMNQVANIFLDSFGWSGGKTTLDALSAGLPVVTCPGEFMRGRHAYGILRMLEVEPTIARSEQEYSLIAIDLGLKSRSGVEIKNEALNHNHQISDDPLVMNELNKFFDTAYS